MVISHLKHSYLNWRANPCRKKMSVVFHHIFWIWLSWFLFGLNRIFQVHDNQFFFLLFFSFFVIMICLLRATTRAIDDLPDWSTTPHVRIILKRGRLLVQRLFTSFLFQRKNMAQKYSRELGNFWSMCLEASIKVILERRNLGTCVFSHWKGLASLKL